MTLPTILLTGHVGDLTPEPDGSPRPDGFVLMQKPVSPTQLASQLATLIANEAA
jgi:hypothetical protein